MKPISLEMYGFMTYKNKTFIDFTKLYEAKIFLISGDTGSGKTSIFDAISFALFGEIQREGFDKDDIRSDFLAGSDEKTYVDFKFEMNDKIYRIKRIPKQIAKKTRSNVNIKHSLELYKYENDKQILISDKPSDGDRVIKEIIGLDYNQLNRVMILAQGEFAKFLKSSSDEKTKLLSKIFQTYIFKDIEEKLKEKSRDSKKRLDEIFENLKSEIMKNEYLESFIEDELIELKNFDKINSIIERSLRETYQSLSEKRKNKDLLEKNLDDINKEYNFLKNQNMQIKSLMELIKEEEDLLEIKEGFDYKKEKLILSQKAILINPYYNNVKNIKENIIAYKEKSNKNEKIIEEIEIELEKIRDDFNNIPKAKEKIDEKKEDAIKLKEIIKEFCFLKKLEERINKEKESYENSKILKIRLEELEKQKNYLIETMNEKSTKLLGLSSNLTKINDKISEAKLKINDLKNIYEKALENNNNIKKLKLCQDKIKDLKVKIEESKNFLSKAIKTRKDKEINRLRVDLNESGICPVCGSIHNKKIGLLKTSDIDYDKVNEEYISLTNKLSFELCRMKDLESLIDKSLGDKNYYEKALEDSKKAYKNLKDEYEKTYKSYKFMENEKEDLDKALEKLGYELKRCQDQVPSYQNFEDIENLKSKYRIKKEELEGYDQGEISKKIKTKLSFIENESKRIKNLEDIYKDLEKSYTSVLALNKSYASYLEDYESNLKRAEDDLKKILKENEMSLEDFHINLKTSKTYTSQRALIEEYFEKLRVVRIKISSLEQYKNKDIVDEDRFIREIDHKKVEIKEIDDQIFDLKLKIDKLTNTNEEVENIRLRLKNLKQEDEILFKLSKISDGSLARVKKREKMNLETFVLTNYFNKILIYANIRLRDMTDGQFRMIRKSISSDRRKNFGLDIEILDANTGKLRSVASLSGGESFIASLSLALGLSDEISQENGGIKIDTLFIDEGFGSLSDDYLDKTIRTIEKLSYDNKFIGLISHVKELKEAIDAKIIVNYSKVEGSSLEVVV